MQTMITRNTNTHIIIQLKYNHLRKSRKSQSIDSDKANKLVFVKNIYFFPRTSPKFDGTKRDERKPPSNRQDRLNDKLYIYFQSRS